MSSPEVVSAPPAQMFPSQFPYQLNESRPGTMSLQKVTIPRRMTKSERNQVKDNPTLPWPALAANADKRGGN